MFIFGFFWIIAIAAGVVVASAAIKIITIVGIIISILSIVLSTIVYIILRHKQLFTRYSEGYKKTLLKLIQIFLVVEVGVSVIGLAVCIYSQVMIVPNLM